MTVNEAMIQSGSLNSENDPGELEKGGLKFKYWVAFVNLLLKKMMMMMMMK